MPRRGGGYRAPTRRMPAPVIPRATIQPVSRLGSPRNNTVAAITNVLSARAGGMQAERLQALERQRFDRWLQALGIQHQYKLAEIAAKPSTTKPLDPVAEGLRVSGMQKSLIQTRAAVEDANAAITFQNAQNRSDWQAAQPGLWGRLRGQQGTPEPTGRALVTMPDTTTLDQTLQYGQQRLGGLMGQASPVPAAGDAAPTADDPIVRTGVDQDTGQRVGLTRSGRLIPLE